MGKLSKKQKDQMQAQMFTMKVNPSSPSSRTEAMLKAKRQNYYWNNLAYIRAYQKLYYIKRRDQKAQYSQYNQALLYNQNNLIGSNPQIQYHMNPTFLPLAELNLADTYQNPAHYNTNTIRAPQAEVRQAMHSLNAPTQRFFLPKKPELKILKKTTQNIHFPLNPKRK